jgi:branched-chain amino acid transport system ATP-binding protein
LALLSVSGLTKVFDGFTAVSSVSFDVEEGEILGLTGPNGSGKSTTFNCIAGMYAPTSGSIKLKGEEIGGLTANKTCHKGIGRTYQIPRPFHNLTILENVALSAWFGQQGKVDRAACWRQAAEALATVGLPTDPRTTTDGFSAALLKKLELARAIATNPVLLLADESLNGLDHGEMEQAADMLHRIRKEKGITIVWVEHIRGVLMRVVDRVVVLDHGDKRFDGVPSAAQSDARVVEFYLGADAAA